MLGIFIKDMLQTQTLDIIEIKYLLAREGGRGGQIILMLKLIQPTALNLPDLFVKRGKSDTDVYISRRC